jgi:hypothetical protein
MTRLAWAGVAALSLLLFAPSAILAQEKDERAGTCSDAKLQMEYFCDSSKAAGDTMVAMGTACENAKKNVAAACEGKAEADKAYQFEKGEKGQ